MSGARRSVDSGSSSSSSSPNPTPASSIRVACRVRPTNASEANAPSCIRVNQTAATITSHSIAGDSAFLFDSVLPHDASQADVYDATGCRCCCDH